MKISDDQPRASLKLYTATVLLTRVPVITIPRYTCLTCPRVPVREHLVTFHTLPPGATTAYSLWPTAEAETVLH